jgi:hypothetical protein
MKRLVTAFVIVVLAPLAVAAPPLGRFFFTQEERVELDAARVKKKHAPAAAPKPPPEVAPAARPTARVVTYGGIVRRSDGRSMLWLNDRLGDEDDALARLNLSGRVRDDGSVSLHARDDTKAIEVKVGQTVHVHTGEVVERTRSGARPGGSSDSAE